MDYLGGLRTGAMPFWLSYFSDGCFWVNLCHVDKSVYKEGRFCSVERRVFV